MSKKKDILKIMYLHASKDIYAIHLDRYHRDLLENQCNYGMKSMRTRCVVFVTYAKNAKNKTKKN